MQLRVKRSNLFMLFILLLFSSVYAQNNSFELVESIPVETSLDNPDIRNTQEVWLEMINSAQKTLDIEQFYISNEKGEPLDTILKAIVAAAKRGIIVRIIVDSKMYDTYPYDVQWLEEQSPNITTRVLDIGRISGGIQHAKFFIVDGYEIFLGSQNFDWRALKHIHELGIRFKGVFELHKKIFEYDWCKAGESSEHCYLSYPLIEVTYYTDTSFISTYMQPTFSSPNAVDKYLLKKEAEPQKLIEILTDLYNINRMISEAKKEINLQFLSYNPNTNDGYWEEIDTALINASKRGVKVKLLVSDWNLSKTAVEHFKTLISYPNFEVRYTSIPEYSGGFIPFARVEHCKYIAADDYVWIGTSNMSRSYFYESRNLGMIIEQSQLAEQVRSIFYKSWNSEYANPIEPNGEYTPRKRDH
jgi:phosphatidylserine/phosphatidylglycerophosphate/cardiolipin synthase-like enzyme